MNTDQKATIKNIGDLFIICINGYPYLTGTEEFINKEFKIFEKTFNF